MSHLRKRIYTYLTIFSIVVLSILSLKPYVNHVDQVMNKFTDIPNGTRMPLRCSLHCNKSYIICPPTQWIENHSKFKTILGFYLDYWSINQYECRLKVSKYPSREFVPQNEPLVISGRFLTEINEGEITHYIFLSSPQEIESIICSSYIEHYTGFWGNICWIFEKRYSKNMTIKEFNRLVTCCTGLIYPSNGDKK